MLLEIKNLLKMDSKTKKDVQRFWFIVVPILLIGYKIIEKNAELIIIAIMVVCITLTVILVVDKGGKGTILFFIEIIKKISPLIFLIKKSINNLMVKWVKPFSIKAMKLIKTWFQKIKIYLIDLKAKATS